MTNQQFRKQVEQLIVDDRLEEAIRLLFAVITASPRLLPLRNDATLFLAQHARLQRDLRIGALSAQDSGMHSKLSVETHWDCSTRWKSDPKP